MHRLMVGFAAGIGMTVAVGGTVAAIAGADEATVTAPVATTTTVVTETTTTTPATTTTTTTAAEHHHGDEHMTVHDETEGAAPTAAEIANADAFLAEVDAGVARFADLEVATAEGYVMNERAASEPGKRKHFHRTVRTPEVLDPTQPEGLVYYIDGDTAILLGAVFVERSDDVLEQPGGPLTVWHDHAEATGNMNAANMMHVWTYDGVANPFGVTFLDSLPADWQRGDPWPFLSAT